MKILVVEDENELLELFKIRLEKEGFEILTAEDGHEGLKLAREKKPDLVILDLMLPRLDGFKVCRMLKFDNRYSSIPILMLTARAEERDRETGMQVGANAYVTKPFEWEELYGQIKDLLNIK